jgi:hypothetical protein
MYDEFIHADHNATAFTRKAPCHAAQFVLLERR